MNEHDRHEIDWLTSKDKEMVGVAVYDLGQQAINQALRSMAKNFSPEECAEIVISAFKKIVDDPRTLGSIISWVELENQASHNTSE